MEKQLSATGYWLGLICTVLALVFHLLTALNTTTNVSFSRILFLASRWMLYDKTGIY
jgi:hypothetical protein